jgi:hypothetical protein
MVREMRRAAKVDANQAEVVDALRRVGASVQPLHAVGAGVPDLLIGYRSMNYLLEVKDGNKPPSARKLTTKQIEWHEAWRGSVLTVTSAEDAIGQLGISTIGKEENPDD